MGVPTANRTLVHPAFGRSWISPNVANADLLYISDGNGEVTVYRYWHRTLAGILTGFTQPMGQCVDKRNDVYITDYGAQQIGEYAHGDDRRLRTIPTAPYSPYGCSVDFVTGDLAVAEIQTNSSKQGNIAIYPVASGQPTYYGDPNISKFYGLAYDSGGNLFTVGQAGRYNGFAWMAHGGTKLIDVKVPLNGGTQWYDASGVQWDGKYFAIDSGDILYLYAVFKGQAFYAGYVYVDICCSGVGPFWVYDADPSRQGTQLVGAYESSGGVFYWHYPAGGDSYAEISHGIDQPSGLTISLKKK
jgi:hypothetical protein